MSGNHKIVAAISHNGPTDYVLNAIGCFRRYLD
jgi:hypothetical protein